jgi:sarcosine dehydrogenase
VIRLNVTDSNGLNVLIQELVDAGCVFEERQGWERPGWFSPKGPAPVPQYDWYGSYGTPRNSDVRYENMLKADHTFDFSKSHQTVSYQTFGCPQPSDAMVPVDFA